MHSNRLFFFVVLTVALIGLIGMVLLASDFYEGYLEGVEEYRLKHNLSTVEYRNFTVFDYIDKWLYEAVENLY